LSFCGDRIRVEDVHSMLGTADETRLAAFAQKMIQRDAAGALRDLNDAASEGVDLGQLAEQLLGYLRDLMALSVGASSDLVRTANPENAAQLKSWGEQWGTMTLISALQILDESIVKMRHSVQTRVLMEIALVQICQLQDLQAIADLAKAFASGQTAPPARVVSSGTVAGPSTTVAQQSNNPSSVDSSKKKDELGSSTVTATATASAESKQSTASVAPTVMQPAAQPITQPVMQPMGASTPSASSSASVASQAAPPNGNVPNPIVEKNSVIEKTRSTADAASSQPHRESPQNSAASAPRPSSQNAAAVTRAEPGSLAVPTKSAEPVSGSRESGDELGLLTKASEKLGGLIVQCVAMIVRVVPISPVQWRAYVCRDGQFSINYLLSADNVRKLAGAIKEISGKDVQIEYILTQEAARVGTSSTAQEAQVVVEPVRVNANQAQLIRGVMHHSLVKHIIEKFDGQIVRVDQPAIVRPPHTHNVDEATVSTDALV
ncbi:MAG: hypothetical protein MUC43_12425, partial [Pirellula sp.]|nr:hypothetical protein [Pirellula sp.]